MTKSHPSEGLVSSDVRGFFAALGIELPGWVQDNASVPCFAALDAHAHEDRRPSCSVSLQTGAWCCHGCGAHGGAYDAALALGHSPRSGIELMIVYGLTERRTETATRRPRQLRPAAPTPERPTPLSTQPRKLAVTEADVQRWHQALFSNDGRWLRERLWRQRRWSGSVMADLQLGHDGQRITIPIRTATGELSGVLRYRLHGGGSKMLAAPGTRLGLIPHPAREPSPQILLVEGLPDVIAARTRGWPAIAVPGARAWQSKWAPLLATRAVTVLMDCDRAGRHAAERIAADLRPLAAVRIRDLAPARDDGYDLTDWLLAQPLRRSHTCATSSSPKPTITR